VFLWQFLLPLIVFVVAYWKIFSVVRRQAKVAADRHRVTVAPKDPVAGTSRGGATSDRRLSRKGVKTGSGGHGQQVRGQEGPTCLSRMQANVVRTMVYITVCFTLCWMPVNLYVMYARLTVPAQLYYYRLYVAL